MHHNEEKQEKFRRNKKSIQIEFAEGERFRWIWLRFVKMQDKS